MSTAYKHLFTGSSIAVLAIKNALELENIIPVIKDNSESGRLAGFGSTPNLQQVFVHAEEESKALAILKNLKL